ncbi:apolipoprotein N-acyltransferase [Candidatus Pelagibacter sp.]|nr:apolipoprotein N-acyltransferase [Candidatus Pelagibacter sp.]
MRIIFKKKSLSYAYIFCLGILSSLSLPPYEIFLINFFTFSALFLFFIKKKFTLSKTEYFLNGWMFGFGYFTSSLYWITISLTFDQSFKILIPVAFLLIPLFLAIFYGLAMFILYFFKKFSNISLILVFSLTFSIFEFIRGNILSGFPWNLISYSFSEFLPLLQILSLIGTYSFNLLCITLFVLPSFFYLKKSRQNLYFVFSFVLLLISGIVYGQLKLEQSKDNSFKNNNFIIKIISPKIGIERFYNTGNEEEIIQSLIKLSKPNKEVKTIFIWPEGIFNKTELKNLKKYQNIFNKKFSNKHLIILGINNTVNEKTFNSMAVVNYNLDLIEVYNKNNLVPFGEFLPLEMFLKNLGMKTITNFYNSYSPGKKRNIINLEKHEFDISFLPLICYEIIYSGKLSNKNNYDLVINISEDGWFGKSIGPHQHFSHSIFRSIEEGKSIIRSTNNGTSALIDPYGQISDTLESTYEGVIEINQIKNPKKTFFSKYGNNMFFYFIFIYISLIFFLKTNREIKIK